MLIIANPTSGKGRGTRFARSIEADLRARGHRAEIDFTTARGDAERIAERRLAIETGDPPDVLVACGGDGTIQEVANALARSKETPDARCPALGLAPAGRCNDFARALGIIPDAGQIANVLSDGSPAAVDLGRIDDRYFCTVATAGLDAEVSRYVDAMRIPLSGTPAYLYGALQVLLRYDPPRVRLCGDFGEIDTRVFLASSANTSSYGGAIPIAPGARPDDGVLELCVIEAMTKRRALLVIPSVLRGRHERHREVRFLRTRRFRIDAERVIELWADGERVGRTPATVEVVPGAVRVILPPDR